MTDSGTPVDPRPLSRLLIGLTPGIPAPTGTAPTTDGILIPIPGRTGPEGPPGPLAEFPDVDLALYYTLAKL